MNPILKWGLILGGVGFLLKDQLASLFTGGDSTPPPQQPPGQPPPPDTAQTTLQMVRSYARQHGFTMLSFDQWNWVYQQVRGAPGPAYEAVFPDQPRERLLTLEEWWAGVTQHGLSGVPNWAARAWGYRG